MVWCRVCGEQLVGTRKQAETMLDKVGRDGEVHTEKIEFTGSIWTTGK